MQISDSRGRIYAVKSNKKVAAPEGRLAELPLQILRSDPPKKGRMVQSMLRGPIDRYQGTNH